MKTWSEHQNRIFDFVAASPLTAAPREAALDAVVAKNGIIKAVAGSGKTTTIVEAMNRIPAGKSALFLAFNKSIAEELKRRGVNARTFHSLTYGTVMRHKGANTVDADKTRKLIDVRMPVSEAKLYGYFVVKMVSLCKQVGVGCLVDGTDDVLADIAEHFDIELEDDKADYAQAYRYVQDVLAMSHNAAMVDFDDLLYVPVRDGLTLQRFDYVFVDEAQDTNVIQRALLRKLLHDDSRVIAVGDPAQAIYGFRGATSDAMDVLAAEFDAVTLPLTVSYRCPTAVVAEAQKYVADIQAAPGAPEGVVESLGTQWDHKVFAAKDLVVCRTTAPLIALAYRLFSQRVPAYVMGRDIGQGLKTLIQKMQGKGVDGMLVKLWAYKAREIEKAKAKGKPEKAAQIDDKVTCITFLADTLKANDRTVPKLLALIDSLFADKANATVLATIHKAKGLEADTVFWLNASKCPSRWARQDWQKQQELNLCYVAVTRAKRRLVKIEDGQ